MNLNLQDLPCLVLSLGEKECPQPGPWEFQESGCAGDSDGQDSGLGDGVRIHGCWNLWPFWHQPRWEEVLFLLMDFQWPMGLGQRSMNFVFWFLGVFLITLMSCRSSWAKDQTHTTAVSQVTAVTTLELPRTQINKSSGFFPKLYSLACWFCGWSQASYKK